MRNAGAPGKAEPASLAGIGLGMNLEMNNGGAI